MNSECKINIDILYRFIKINPEMFISEHCYDGLLYKVLTEYEDNKHCISMLEDMSESLKTHINNSFNIFLKEYKIDKNIDLISELITLVKIGLIVFAFDISGSTGGHGHYFKITSNLYYKYYDMSQVFEGYIRILKWHSDCVEIDKKKFDLIMSLKIGEGGTSPVTIVDFIKDFHGTLVFISDGEISPDSSSYFSMKILENGCKFKEVFIHLIKNYGTINESVSCALTRNSEVEIFRYEDKTNISNFNNIKIDFGVLNELDTINSIEEFVSKSKLLKDALITKNMGTDGNEILKKKVVDLKNRLVRSISKNNDDSLDNLIKSVVTDKNPSIKDLEDVFDKYYNPHNDLKQWQKELDSMISWCSGLLKNIFDRNTIETAINKVTNREQKAPTTELVTVDKANNLPEDNTSIPSDKLLTDVISLEDIECMVLLIKDHIPMNFVIDNDLINCPLSATYNTDFISYLKSSLDSYMSLESFKALYDMDRYNIISPTTRAEIKGVICLAKDKSHVNVTNSILKHCLTKGKKLGNTDLWFASIYLIIKNGNIPHMTDCLPYMEQHLLYRMYNSKTYMTLSGLPTYPVYSVPLIVALWSCINATCFTTDPKCDPLRLHLEYSEDIIELLKLANISVPEQLIQHIKRTKVMRKLLYECKKGKKDKLKNLEHALIFNSIKVEDTWIPIDGIIRDEQIKAVIKELSEIYNDCSYLSRNELLHIIPLCARSCSLAESDVQLLYDMNICDYKISKIQNWKYDENTPYVINDICVKTCRPYYHENWVNDYKVKYGHINFISINRQFVDYICNYTKYPTKNDFFMYIYKRISMKSSPPLTLPICVDQFIDEVFEEYKNIMKDIKPDEFVKRWNESVNKDKRIEIQNN